MSVSLPVPGFPGYTVTDDGRVFSTRPWRGDTGPRELRAGVNRGGYKNVALCDGAHRRTRDIHSIVAEAFLGPRPTGADVRHLDGNPLNNHVSNLAYGSRTENLLDAVRHGTHYNAKKTHCPSGHPYDEANTSISSTTGERSCRACARANKRAQRERQMMAAANVRMPAA